MKRFGPVAILGLVLLMGAAAFVAVEVIQRRRFDSRASVLNDALVEFKSTTPIRKDSRKMIVEASPGDPGIGAFAMMSVPSQEHDRFWMLEAVIPAKDASRTTTQGSVLQITLYQRRRIVLLSPEVYVSGVLDQPLQDRFDAVLRKHDVSYGRNNAPWMK